MSDTLERIKQGLEEIFPEAADMEITPDMELGELPDWDSMSSVNFQTFIEEEFSVTIPQDRLNENVTVNEVIEMIENPEKIDQVA